MGIPNPILYFPSNHSLTTNVPFPCLWTDLNNYFFFDLEIRWGFQIRYYTFPKMTNWSTEYYHSCFCIISHSLAFFFFKRFGTYGCCHSCCLSDSCIKRYDYIELSFFEEFSGIFGLFIFYFMK